MKQNFKLIPFNLLKAKTPANPNGLEVVTRVGRDARIIDTNYKGIDDGRSIIGIIQDNDIKKEMCHSFYINGRLRKDRDDNDDLFLKEPIEARRMTNQELAWWLRKHPEEHREYTYDSTNQSDGLVRYEYVYHGLQAHNEVDGLIKIRSNGGEWREPLIEVEEE